PMETIQLNGKNLSLIKGPVITPQYERQTGTMRIVHIGLGHFHRAHQAVYLDKLLASGKEKFPIFEMNLVADPPGRSPDGLLGKQDYLYTLITRGDREEVRVVGSIGGYLNAAGAKEKAIERLAAETTELITLTVTEGGYHYNQHTGELLRDDPAVKNDLERPGSPETAAGFLAAGLVLRYKTNKKPLNILCCDNIPANGKLLRHCVFSLLQENAPEIIPWVEDSVAFPSSMVDRITPGTTEERVKELEKLYGIADAWPVFAEDFIQWVLEDNFVTGATAPRVPDYAAAGVQLVKDVEPYELMKMRLLNGSHSALAYPSYLLGYRRVDEAMQDPLIRDFIREHYMEEVTVTLSPVPGIDIEAYKDTLIRRFSNKNTGDAVLRLASEGSSKIPNFMLKPLREAVKKRLPHTNMIFALAAWARFLSGEDEAGKSIPIEDARGAEISAAAKKAQKIPGLFLKTVGLEGLSGEEFTELEKNFAGILETIYRKGMREALSGIRTRLT
ncbi:MAG: mannitol dehydrogenase family protein, partial [Treponema sp.]|nr:mannitol dehydrogenase family protein [Treponema sp.]